MSADGIVVCGAGIAGLAAALAFTKAGCRVVVLGPAAPAIPLGPGEYHPRVYAISPGSRRFLEDLGVWGMLDAARVTPVEAMEVYGDAGGKVVLDAWQATAPTLAWIVESGELERVLGQAVRVFGIDWRQERFEGLGPGRVKTETGDELPAALVVGADGAASPVRVAAGIAHTSRPYHETGLVAHLDAELPHQNIALQWFTPDGVLALLPMPDTPSGPQVSMVWSMPAGQATELLTLPHEECRKALALRLAAASAGRLGRLDVRSGVRGFPLFLEKSAMAVSGVALVGDAAHRVHPLAGQGLNLGLGDVEQLIDVVRAREGFRGVGDVRVLARYRRARAEPVMAMSFATDGLHRVFASSFPPLVMARNAGMRLVDRLPGIKRFLIDGASGS